MTVPAGQVDQLVAPIPANTRYVPAGALTIGIERRELNARIFRENFGHDPQAMEFFESMMDVDDVGVTLHVCSTDDMRERLRFDAFGETAHLHYHYVFPDGSHRKVDYDAAACGDLVEWALRTMTERLPEMLREAGAPELADRVDAADLVAALPSIVAAVDELAAS